MEKDVLCRSNLDAILKTLLRQYNAESAILFGSYARGQATAQSDIDIIVIGGSAFDPTDIFALAEDLHRQTNKPVDVYELRELDKDSPFYHSVFSEGVRIA